MPEYTQNEVVSILTERQLVINHLQRIAFIVQSLRDEDSRYPKSYGQDSFFISDDGLEDGLVSALWYSRGDDNYVHFPLCYAWQKDFEELERAAIAERKIAAAEAKENATRIAEEAAEQHERAYYEKLKAKFEGQLTSS